MGGRQLLLVTDAHNMLYVRVLVDTVRAVVRVASIPAWYNRC